MTKTSQLKPRSASLKKICDPETNEVLDRGLCFWFPEPNSFTGENSTEFHVHGGPAVISSILSALSKLRFVPAAPGEFTKRAFLNGKLDLTVAEGIGDLINAETEKQRRQASDQANGSLKKLYDSWRHVLLNSLASLEAHIDFSEEYAIQSSVVEKTNASLRLLCREIEKHLSDSRKGEILRNGIKVVIMGEPNVGKSSLLNLLSGRNAAIVNSSPGTTRDILELTIDILGYPMIIADTAGIRTNAQDEIEIEGIRRAKKKVLDADLVICMANAKMHFRIESEECLENYRKSLGLERKRVLTAVNKSDLVTEEIKNKWRNKNCVILSCKTGEGIKDLTDRLGEHFKDICGNPSEENPIISRERHRNHLSRTVDHCKAYFDRVEAENFDVAISLHDIRNAANEIGHITGHVTGEEILDVIFKKFCIGK